MPLTKEEREFLDAYVYEATHEPFGGPATSDLRRREIFYADLHGLLTGYHREACRQKNLPFGKHNPNPPPSPWPDCEQTRLRSRVVLDEHTRAEADLSTAAAAATSNADSSSDRFESSTQQKV